VDGSRRLSGSGLLLPSSATGLTVEELERQTARRRWAAGGSRVSAGDYCAPVCADGAAEHHCRRALARGVFCTAGCRGIGAMAASLWRLLHVDA